MRITSTTARKTGARVIAALALAALLGGCAIGNTGHFAYARHTTIGSELIDLKKAKEAGAITDTEYRDLRRKIMKDASFSEKTAEARFN